MVQAVSASRLSDVIGAIYDCAIEPERWPGALDRLCSELGFVNAVLAVQPMPAGQGVLLSAASGLSQAFFERLGDYDVEILDQWGGAQAVMTAAMGEPFVLSRVNPDACRQDRQDRYYKEWRQPQGLVDSLNVILMREPDMVGSLSFGRHERLGLIGDEEVSLTQLLIPHLQRAVKVSRLLEARSLATATFQTVLDHLAQPVLLTGPGMEIVYANAAASQLLDDGELVREVGGKLRGGSVGVTAALTAAVEQAARDENAIRRKGMGVPASHSTRGPHAFHVLPLLGSGVRARLAPRAVAAIFVSATTRAPGVPSELVASLFDLTPAEIRVLQHISTGLTVGATAQALGVEPSTVKTHLLRLFDKLGARRQAELVAIANSLAPPIQSGDSTQ